MMSGIIFRQQYARRTVTVTHSSRTLISILALGALVLACSPAAAPSASSAGATTQPASAAVSPAGSAGAIVLDRTGPIGCDSIGIDYKVATIMIDAASDPNVWAVTDTAKKIAAKWTAGFTVTDGPEPVVQDSKGAEVARNGTAINVPEGANPRLAGYFVCLAPDALYVLETDPQ